jgi:hypothetical protein
MEHNTDEVVENTDDEFLTIRIKSSTKGRLDRLQFDRKQETGRKIPLSELVELAIDGEFAVVKAPERRAKEEEKIVRRFLALWKNPRTEVETAARRLISAIIEIPEPPTKK